ncbi:MAG: dienelactone hydrolase family protein [Burkholderiales bacterium]
MQIQAGSVVLEGLLTLPGRSRGLVMFVHGSGSSRFSSRNLAVASYLNKAGFATLLFDLLTEDEQKIDERTGALRFDIRLLTERLLAALEWVRTNPETRGLKIGLFGASTGAAAALNVAATTDADIGGVVSRGGRPDLGAAGSLPLVRAPTLLIVGELDSSVIALNLRASAELICEHKMHIVPGASHLFEEPGTLEEVARVACGWFEQYLPHAISQTKAAAVTP